MPFDKDVCIECGGRGEHTHHCIFGINRQNSEKYGLKVRLCFSCHEKLHFHDKELELKYRRLGQQYFEKTHTHEEYMRIFGRNYLEEESMNKVMLMGRLTRDPDIRYTGEGMCIGRFTLAVNRRPTKDGRQEADFISCLCFAKTAEFAEKYLHQGTKISTVGRIQTGSYTNKDGQKVYTTDVVIEEMEFAESKSNTSNTAQTTSQPAAAQVNEGFMSIPDGVEDEGLPFN